jgi:hypothetical protein
MKKKVRHYMNILKDRKFILKLALDMIVNLMFFFAGMTTGILILIWMAGHGGIK